MKNLLLFGSPARDCRAALSIVAFVFFSFSGLGQGPAGPAGQNTAKQGMAVQDPALGQGPVNQAPALRQNSASQDPASWKLEKMPADLETDYALSSMPPYVRNGATVYLLDPEKGFYVARQGTNGFICFVARTDWPSGEFRQDFAAAISYDAEGAKAIFPAYADVEAMRASGKFTGAQVKDSMKARFANGFYKAPAKPGLSYMLAPVMRVYTDSAKKSIATFSMPHYMFYAPYFTPADIGGNSDSGGPIVIDVKSAQTYIILPAGEMEKAKMNEDNAQLLKRLIAYKSYFDPGQQEMHH